MSHKEYWDYLKKIQGQITDDFSPITWSEAERLVIFKLTVSPYHYWLKDKALTSSLPKESSATQSSAASEAFVTGETALKSGTPPVTSQPEDSSNLANITQPEILKAVALDTLARANLANKAQEIRSKARTSIKEYMKTREKTMSSDATTGLLALANDWGKGMTVYKALDRIPDRELCLWNEKYGVFE